MAAIAGSPEHTRFSAGDRGRGTSPSARGAIAGQALLSLSSKASLRPGSGQEVIKRMSRPSADQRRALETAVIAEFQSLPACRGVTLLPVTDPMGIKVSPEAKALWYVAEHMELGYDLHLDPTGQTFSVVWLGDFKGVEIRASSPRELVQHVCTLAKGQGGTVIR
jgi:hypothetical protein